MGQVRQNNHGIISRSCLHAWPKSASPTFSQSETPCRRCSLSYLFIRFGAYVKLSVL